MKTAWHVRRTTRAGTDGERRWDYAYQFLLQWARASGASEVPAPIHYKKEADHGNRAVCPSLDHPATPYADH
jgi:hypothetical protein